MRVELLYAPGCTRYKKMLHELETVIAEEGLPIAIEMIEVEQKGSNPTVRVNGAELTISFYEHELEGNHRSGSSSTLVGRGAPCVEQLRALLSRHWQELTIPV
jgi:hypothetical protein